MVTKHCYTRFGRLVLLFLFGVLIPSAAGSTEVIDLQRGIHRGFELFVLYCDSLPEFRMFYDRVEKNCRLEISRGIFSARLAQAARSLKRGRTVESIELSGDSSTLVFRFIREVHLRAYIVNGPPALMLDVGVTKDNRGFLPFELGKDEYLELGGFAERDGRLDIALAYLEHVKVVGGDEPLLTHRAGIIQHRMGRWEAALESFTRTSGLDEFAADAHAHQAMIYLAIGDTASSGEAWSSYFHRDPLSNEPVSPADETVVAVEEPAPQPVTNKWGKNAGSIIEAGEGSYLYLGWISLIAGAFFLVRLLIASSRDSGRVIPTHSNDNNGYEDIPVKKRPVSGSARSARRAVQHGLAAPFPRPDTAASVKPESYSTLIDAASSLSDFPPKISTRVVGSYGNISRKATAEGPVKPPRRRGPASTPVDMILSKANDGENELEIARSLSIGRDEVAMVLNLARLAGRSFDGTQN